MGLVAKTRGWGGGGVTVRSTVTDNPVRPTDLSGDLVTDTDIDTQTHTHTHTHTHRGTRTHEHSDYTKLNLLSYKNKNYAFKEERDLRCKLA